MVMVVLRVPTQRPRVAVRFTASVRLALERLFVPVRQHVTVPVDISSHASVSSNRVDGKRGLVGPDEISVREVGECECISVFPLFYQFFPRDAFQEIRVARG